MVFEIRSSLMFKYSDFLLVGAVASTESLTAHPSRFRPPPPSKQTLLPLELLLPIADASRTSNVMKHLEEVPSLLVLKATANATALS